MNKVVTRQYIEDCRKTFSDGPIIVKTLENSDFYRRKLRTA